MIVIIIIIIYNNNNMYCRTSSTTYTVQTWCSVNGDFSSYCFLLLFICLDSVIVSAEAGWD